MNRYRLQTATDGTVWVSLQPLLEDINEQMTKPEVMSNQLVGDSLHAVRAFVAALIDEARLDQYRGSDSDETPYRDTLQ